MKKIGILFGMENTFPNAFIERVNSKGEDGIIAEAVTIDKVIQAAPNEYAVIIDRISQDVPFYRSFLKNAALTGTAVINNPFWWSADEKFFNNALAEKLGIPVPKTVLLPSKQRPDNTTETSFRNLAFPMAWEEIFQYVGFPAYMKPHDGGGWKSVYRVVNPQDMWIKHEETGQLVMMLQEEIVFDDYVRCYCIGQKDVLVMPYEPRNPHHLRYAADLKAQGEEREKLLETIKDYTLKLNVALGYDFNTVEFAVRGGIPYAIDFCNPAPDADIYSVGRDNFEWVVEAAANMAIERAKSQVPGQINLTWGTFINQAVNGIPAVTQAEAAPETPAPAAKPAEPAKVKAPAKPAKTAEKAPAAAKAPAKTTAPAKAAKPAPAKPVKEATPSATEVKVKAVAPKKPAKSLGAIVTEPIAAAEPAEPKIPTTKAAATKAPAKNSKLKKS
ncbi:glutathione synthase/RimK-type ligase-like ATP-grasp enzyme [Dyadobacter sp. BE34]|uniref:Glutathione synthase/RimK-type ligase-like ATP-grasp enzyme n=1 Tax=Dyadobacter fermentans TaxID=94254 RepID=A0ABU1QZA8_9BACT|nr:MULTISPECIES: glutathione synthase [Dyadobacter]MDR6806445.1 glutathione synthase/RimK-type ligase-like ATP-grasp enzyme [Dyadobacter fermentans]MDR7044186.1 glutathione synthase/RimK-type ligase-like ATP-grasp enzyme [Dyadobacter sp. BE242]MDR7198497.1 glutathione synthase/RimK-type ligase-like ATP-grasp enzyme [Dyadobacter sp. BE34]MDR7216459.1 glutathione synthase/RimK-type ligase-like ATP-grasp enzyme [Dyadobacter sp. BE31]MDR7264014.1 glutathione synthase/RimK-type ligase-like ATP-gras